MYSYDAAFKIAIRRMRTSLDPSRAFTLIEMLVVIAIISIMAALLLPVFLSARADARRMACLSNMHQISEAMYCYAQDFDDLYPYGADPSDQHSYPSIWPPAVQPIVSAMPQLNTVLEGYLRAPGVWCCPSDSGFDHMDTVGETWVYLPARPSMFKMYGMSYLYRTQIALLHKTVGNLTAFEPYPYCGEHGPAEVNVLMDGNGSWHGLGQDMPDKRYNVMMGDGHVVSLNAGLFYQTWTLSLTNPCDEPGS
jgi:general secretion pathway protein G